MRTIKQRLIEELNKNAGYYSDHTHFAIEYNVALHYADTTVENLIKVARRDLEGDFELFEEPDEHLLSDFWQQAQESLGWSLGRDCSNYRSFTEEACRFAGLTYKSWPRKYVKEDKNSPHASARSWTTSESTPEFDAEYGLYGRGGKHLCVTEFQHKDLTISTVNLTERLEDDEECRYYGYTDQWCRELLAAMQIWKEEFTPKAASAELETQVAWELLSWSSERASESFNEYNN